MHLVVKAIDRSKLVLMPTQARTKFGGIAAAHRWKSPKAPEKKPLLAPNGKPSNLTPEQWKQVRTPEFKAWFGNWENLAKKNFLTGSPVLESSGTEVPELGKTSKIVEWADNYFREKTNRKVNHPELGTIMLNKQAIKDSLSHSYGPEKIQAIALLPEALPRMILLTSEARKAQEIGHLLACPVRMGSSEYNLLALVKEKTGEKYLYVHEAILIEKIRRSSKTGYLSTDRDSRAEQTGSIKKILQDIYAVNDESVSKVVDENGEPLVVFHGTNRVFEEFKASSAPGWGKGSYFTDDKESAKEFGDNLMEVFLSIKTPYIDGKSIITDRQAESTAAYKKKNAEFREEWMNRNRGEDEEDCPDLDWQEVASENGEFLNKIIRELGYDGVIAQDSNNINGKEIVVFNPHQIKSAIVNQGTFDGNNPNINKSLTFSGHKLQDRMTIHGMDISIENKKGSVRRGVDKDGHAWRTKMHFAYGYVRGTVGKDKDHLDCYIGPDIKSEKVYIIHQNDPTTGKYDEDKVMLCFSSAIEAKRAYLGQYDRPGFFGSMVETDIETFKKRAFSVGTKGKKLVVKAIPLGLNMGEK